MVLVAVERLRLRGRRFRRDGTFAWADRLRFGFGCSVATLCRISGDRTGIDGGHYRGINVDGIYQHRDAEELLPKGAAGRILGTGKGSSNCGNAAVHATNFIRARSVQY